MNVSAIGRNFSAPINQSIQQTPNALLANYSYNNYNNSDTFEKTNNVNNQPSFGGFFRDLWNACTKIASGKYKLGESETARLKNSTNMDGVYHFMSKNEQDAYNSAESWYEAVSGEKLDSSAKDMDDETREILNWLGM